MCSRPLEGGRVDHQCHKVISDFPRFADGGQLYEADLIFSANVRGHWLLPDLDWY